jgi:putative transposase
MSYYERNLPHWHPEGCAIFLTWRLHGSFDKFRRHLTRPDPGKEFARMDRALDAAKSGPTWLKIPEIADSVESAFHFGASRLNLYSLIAYCIMPNHVHLVIVPKVDLGRITKSLKGFTARKANELLGRIEERFWQDESYDHWVRSHNELQKIIAYVERNPVRVGLSKSADEWTWSSASKKNQHRQECLCHI